MHSCALTTQGEVYCWGANGQGQLGQDPFNTPMSDTPVLVPGLSDVKELAVGWDSNCAIMDDDTLRCWGANHFGQLGDGSMTSYEEPLDPELEDVVSVALGFSATCAATADGDVYCWGWNQFGQLGFAPTAPEFWDPNPQLVSGVSSAVEVSVGFGHACAHRANGEVVCWGSNYLGELGDGTSGSFENPPTDLDLEDVNQIRAGNFMTCAHLTTGRIHCWGQNDRGQVGNGNQPNEALVPTEVIFP